MEKLYALFVQTGSEKKVIDWMLRNPEAELYLPFVVEKKKHYRVRGIDQTKTEVMFPGYVFVETDLPSEAFVQRVKLVLRHLSGLHRVVNSEHGADCCGIEGTERESLLKIAGGQGNERAVEISEGVMVGDRVAITSGPLVGMESAIRKVNRHKRLATIEVWLFNEVKLVTVGLEVVEKVVE